jgi:hypothetical protein
LGPETQLLSLILALVWVAVASASLFSGLEYYLLPLEERAFSPLAPLFAPTGLVGQGLGIVGTAMILVGVVGYAIRKRSARLASAGQLRHWLQVHIFLCTLGPWLVLLHTTFKFGGIVSIAFWSMAVVVLSGVFGRYLYVRIPKTLNGRFLGVEALRERMGELSGELEARAGISSAELELAISGARVPPGSPGLAAALAIALREGLRGRLRQRRVHALLRARSVPPALHREVMRMAREQARLEQQVMLLEPFQRLFHLWHVFHLPLALVMALVLAVHVGVAVLFGYTWIF